MNTGRKGNKWYKLDNAAIIIPCSAHGADTRVFRIACELNEDVDPAQLQVALDETLKEFPYLNSCLRKGLFWYYLDALPFGAKVEEDAEPVMFPIYIPGRRNLLYRVTYYKRRINLEMFHVLADGTGALIFLRRLLTNYLSAVHHLEPCAAQDCSSADEKTIDAFSRYYQHEKDFKIGQLKSVNAYQLHGERDMNQLSHVVEAVLSARQFVDAAHKYNTTVGVFATSLYIAAVIDGMSIHDSTRPVVVSVPVNLRQFFPSDTTRNFFGVITIIFYAKDYDGDLQSIIKVVKYQFSEQLQHENISNTMNSFSALVHNMAIKFIPLVLKEPGLTYFIYLQRKGVTASMSNMERITMPDEITPYIDHFAAFMSAPGMQVTMATFGDKLVFGSAGTFTTHPVMLRFYRRLTEMGIDVEIATNDYNDHSADKTEAR